MLGDSDACGQNAKDWNGRGDARPADEEVADRQESRGLQVGDMASCVLNLMASSSWWLMRAFYGRESIGAAGSSGESTWSESKDRTMEERVTGGGSTSEGGLNE